MLRKIVISLSIFLAQAIDVSAARQADPIGEKLAKARDSSESKTSKARESFLQAMETRLNTISKKAQLDDIKRVKSETDAFRQDGTMPTNPFVALDRKNYETAVARARSELKKALEAAKAEYVKAGQLAEAEAIDSELRSGASPVVEREERTREPLDPIVGFWRIVIGERGTTQTVLNVYFPPVDNPGVRSAMARRNQTSPVKYFQGSWSKSGDIYTLHGPNGATAKVKMGGGGEGFAGRAAAGAAVVGFRQQR
ncbi:hypothetical protein GC170_10220 [bacterium]|nr:hypothetical protein [bacterium]